ncbi:UbiX family flavin prenyltransferase [Thermocrinis minervae]|uniref:Flavin prenyltransferase UbiX n=1 Tax=Thermocrinis minervae TaxID=381751 RepID=A0A1M6TF61_9AQUI|nr:UbiX family flavin prenyltransferase [Thermocrinis minervae]SHK55476.1 4-hydroxy-3-polyprenylbenzoate decarboxylase [Thermocrinis minervae]
MNHLVVCITGASGAVYGYRLLQILKSLSYKVDLIVSSSGYTVLKEELGKSAQDLKEEFPDFELIHEKDFLHPVASGSRLVKYKGVVVAPCSMSTLGCVANGINQNLIHRVCEVALKERVPLVLLVREAPYSLIHVENMKKVIAAGAIVIPASPGFYNKPKSIQDLVDFVVGKILDALRIEHNVFRRWKEGNP